LQGGSLTANERKGSKSGTMSSTNLGDKVEGLSKLGGGVQTIVPLRQARERNRRLYAELVRSEVAEKTRQEGGANPVRVSKPQLAQR